jgi:hypothetical protein
MNALTLFTNAITEWKKNQYRGTIIVPQPFSKETMLSLVVNKIYIEQPRTRVVISTNSFETRANIVEYLTHQENNEPANNAIKTAIENKYLCIVTTAILDNVLKYNCLLYINYDCLIVDDSTINLMNGAKFILSIFHANYAGKNNLEYYKKAPVLNCFTQQELTELRVTTPIEEEGVGITIPEDSRDFNLLKYYEDYIATSLTIFGSFDNMEKARNGNKVFNISSAQICYKLAKENGWDEHLDMSNELNVQIDALFNPNNILDRAYKTYEIIRKRNNLLASYEPKINSVIKIIEDNPSAKILVINKKGEFAATLTNAINNHFGKRICGDYHDKLDKAPLIDSNGKIERIKSGKNKGDVKYVGAQAQCSFNQDLFLHDKLNVLSTSNLPSPKLKGYFDIIIITSPSCEDFETYLYRLQDVRFNGEVIKLFTIYVKNSSENNRLYAKKRNQNHTLITDENFNVNNENNLGFIVVD